MAEEIKINKQLFHERLAHLVSTWKADRRGGDALFGGVGSMLVLLGKADRANGFSKSSAMNVSTELASARAYTSQCFPGLWLTRPWQFWLLGYEFPATLFLITTEKLYVVTTSKKGMPCDTSVI